MAAFEDPDRKLAVKIRCPGPAPVPARLRSLPRPQVPSRPLPIHRPTQRQPHSAYDRCSSRGSKCDSGSQSQDASDSSRSDCDV